MTAETSPRGVRGGAQPPRTRGVPGGRPPGQALLTAAEELFGERSYHRTTVADICARAGMATGSFYSYFGSKAGIFAAVVRAINTDLRRAMRVARFAPYQSTLTRTCQRQPVCGLAIQ